MLSYLAERAGAGLPIVLTKVTAPTQVRVNAIKFAGSAADAARRGVGNPVAGLDLI